MGILFAKHVVICWNVFPLDIHMSLIDYLEMCSSSSQNLIGRKLFLYLHLWIVDNSSCCRSWVELFSKRMVPCTLKAESWSTSGESWWWPGHGSWSVVGAVLGEGVASQQHEFQSQNLVYPLVFARMMIRNLFICIPVKAFKGIYSYGCDLVAIVVYIYQPIKTQLRIVNPYLRYLDLLYSGIYS